METPNLPKYDPEHSTNIVSWFKFFNRQCTRLKLDEQWKLNNLINYLDSSAFNFFLEHLSEIEDFSLVQERLILRFSFDYNDAFSKFINLKLHKEDDIKSYFDQKISSGMAANLSDLHILQGLTEGIQLTRLKAHVISAQLKTIQDWKSCVFELAELTKSSSTDYRQRTAVRQPSNLTQSPASSSRFHNQATAQPRSSNVTVRPSSSAGYAPRPAVAGGGSRLNPSILSPRAPSWRQPSPAARQSSSLQAPTSPNYRANSVRLPPSPCPICAQNGLPAQWHWKRVCPETRESTATGPWVAQDLLFQPHPQPCPELSEELSPSE